MPRDPRDKIGRNPTGRPTKSSAGKRRQEERKFDRLLEGSKWEMATEPEPQHEETDDEAPPQWDDSPHREDGHS